MPHEKKGVAMNNELEHPQHVNPTAPRLDTSPTDVMDPIVSHSQHEHVQQDKTTSSVPHVSAHVADTVVAPRISTSSAHAQNPCAQTKSDPCKPDTMRKKRHVRTCLVRLGLALVLVLAGAGVDFGVQNYLAQTRGHSSQGNSSPLTIDAHDQDTSTAKAAAAKALPSVVSIGVQKAQGSGVGSGVMLDSDGNILTNYHVVANAQAVSVTIANKTYSAKVVGSDPSSDIAVIKADLEGDEVTPIEAADSDKLSVGDWVMSVGSPYGLNQSVSAGIISSLARNQSLRTKSGTTLYTNLIQTDASINPGNSGGALVNAEGKLVGICTLFSSTSGAFSGIGFAIPSNYAMKIAHKILNGEKVTHAYIGLAMQTINAQNASHYRLPVTEGAYVADVAATGPAEKAGIKKGDIITAVDDKEITSADAMILNVRSHEIGQTVRVTVWRDKEKKTFDVTLGSDEALQQQQNTLQKQQTPNADPFGAPKTNEDDSDDSDQNGQGTPNQRKKLQRLKEFIMDLNNL